MFKVMNLRAIKLHFASRKAKAKGLAILLVLVGVIGYSLFNLAPQTAATMCNPKSYTVKIIDQSVTGLSEVPSVESLSDPHFRSFITSVRDHVLSKFVGKQPCQENSDGEPMIKLRFVRLPLVMSVNQPITPTLSLDTSSSDGTHQLYSPWAKLAIRRTKSPLVRAVFIWNERQFLLDQALMSGARDSPTQPLVPIDDHIFGQFVQDYTDSVLLASSPEARSAAQASIAKRLPPEVLWLLRHAWQSTLAPFSTEVDHALRSTVQRAAIEYTNLTKALIDQCFTSAKTEIHYESVIDLKDIFSLDKYRINRLH